MKRVLPDQDINWEALPPDHPIYTKTYFPEIKAVPSGMNFYQEPVYALKKFGEVSVIYTANDYGDMWQIGLDEQGQIDGRRDESGRWVALNTDIYFQARRVFPQLRGAAQPSSARTSSCTCSRWETSCVRPRKAGGEVAALTSAS